MSDEHLVFTVEQTDQVTIFTNNSECDLWISLKPVKPKRKYIDIAVVPSKQFVIYDQSGLDLSKVCFTLNKKGDS